MKPVAIFRASSTEGPGYFATYLARRGIEWQVVKLDAGESVPRDARKYSGLVFMGGPMSVNDSLPWIAPALELARDAVRKDVPLLGHCLGGQLMSKALGGVVKANAVKEIGWGEVRVCDNEVARSWMGDAGAGEAQGFESFHWHGETFSIPPGGTRVMENAHCANQAFALGKHFGMQCHVEMTRELIESWLESGAREIAESRASPGVQDPSEIRRDIDARLARLGEIANRIYERWV
ncbi:MAG TPA: type 1 glutamine amidotransferase, partial [Burkholderiales bacterium]|nr:type 1 glutamine amidotransferase [Burkholderiales bacterium]